MRQKKKEGQSKNCKKKNWTQRSLRDRCHVLKWSHACAEGWGSIGWRYSDVQVVSDLEALRLQREGVFRALPTRHRAANIFQPGKKKKKRERRTSLNPHVCFTQLLSVTVAVYQPINFPSQVGVDDAEAEVCPLFPGLWVHFLHQAGQLLQSGIHPRGLRTEPVKACRFQTLDAHKSRDLPCVYLQLTGGNIATGKFIHSVMSAAVCGEHSKEEGAGLQKTQGNIEDDPEHIDYI